MKKLLVICSLVFSITLYAQRGENKDTPISDTTISQQENMVDSLIDYLNKQDWSYLQAKEDWAWHGKLFIHFNRHGISNRVKYSIEHGYVHQEDFYSRTKRQLKRQVKQTLLNRDLSELNPPSRYKIKISLNYSADKKELVWSR